MKTHELKGWREHHNMKQGELAALLGVTVNAYANWEAGRRGIPGPVIRLMQVYRTLEIMAPDVFAGVLQIGMTATPEPTKEPTKEGD